MEAQVIDRAMLIMMLADFDRQHQEALNDAIAIDGARQVVKHLLGQLDQQTDEPGEETPPADPPEE